MAIDGAGLGDLCQLWVILLHFVLTNDTGKFQLQTS